GIDIGLRRETLDALSDLDALHRDEIGDTDTGRAACYESAFAMQAASPVYDIRREPLAVQQRYGAEPGRATFAGQCLLARRLVAQGVRFVQVHHGNWDHHGDRRESDIRFGLRKRCAEVDRPIAALLADLKARGLLHSTLVIWGGEFGRTPTRENG